jgi:hypothetical protein
MLAEAKIFCPKTNTCPLLRINVIGYLRIVVKGHLEWLLFVDLCGYRSGVIKRIRWPARRNASIVNGSPGDEWR